MKKLIALLITVCLFGTQVLPASATEVIYGETGTAIPVQSYLPSVAMAINSDIVVSDGVQGTTTAPILVCGKTYVELYAVAPYLNLDVQWIPAEVGYFKVTSRRVAVDVTLISAWDQLLNQKYKFFVIDSKIYVSLREMADFSGVNISYSEGLITLGDDVVVNREIFGNINTSSCDDYVYAAYPALPEYVINPYQAYSYETMMSDARKLETLYPDLIKTYPIGKSVENRDLLLIEFGRGEPRIFVCGTHHAREYISTTYLMYAIDRYAYAYRTNSMWGQYNPKSILDNVTFCIVPMVNPDGVNLVQNGIYATQYAEELSNMKIYEGAIYGYSAWKANVRGVDVNWNYDKDWTLSRNKNPRGSTGFNGDMPNTEPETAAVSYFVDNHTFEAFMSFHTQGQIFYWADNPDNPTGLHNAIRNDTGFTGYKDSGTGVGGSFFDYVYRKYQKPTITVELCPYVGNYPYPNTDFDTVWRPAKNILLVAGNHIMQKKGL